MLYLPIFYIIIFVTFLCVCYNKPINKRSLLISLVLFVLSLAIIGFGITPKPTYDLHRHYEELNIIRESKIDFINFVFNSNQITDNNYRFMFSFNVYRYIIANLFENSALPFITLLLAYGIFSYILLDFYRDKEIQGKKVLLSLLLCLALMPYVYLYSGIRNGLAASLAALAVYLLLYKKKRLVIFFCLVFISSTMHIITLVIVPFVLLSKVKPGPKGVLFAVFTPLILKYSMRLFQHSGIAFLTMIGKKYYNYTFVHRYYQGRTFVYAPIILSLITLCLLFYFRSKKSEFDRTLNFVGWYILFGLGNIGSYQIVMRLPQVLAFLTPILVHWIYNIGKNNLNDWEEKVYKLVQVLLYLISGYVSYSSLIWLI